ncbi:MAG: NAD(P)/FAD-dependent oxidoreductase [Ardenticatenaceae bacterium]
MSILNTIQQNNEYDVVICGAGFAGQTLARQLKLNYPDLSILIIEKAHFPVTVAGHKVGESTVDASGYYLSDVLKLHDYLHEKHLLKLGFRFFWDDEPQNGFSHRPELGLSEYYPFHAYQLDRGVFENDLYFMNLELGIKVIDQASVADISIHQGQLHEVQYKERLTKCTNVVKARWVIDAMGRRSFLQKKFNLRIKSKTSHSAVWFRVKGRVDVADLVPEGETTWHERVPNRMRYYSTNHLMGHGYWIWLIPLSSGYTSVGIVTSEKFHSFSEYNTHQRAMNWLAEHDPILYNFVQEYEIVDFLKVRNYTSFTSQIFSSQRWGCVGNAATFSDPFYSPGAVVIAYENSLVSEMIGLDIKNELTKERVSFFNDFALSVNDNRGRTIQSFYSYLDQSQVMSLRFLWDVSVAWALDLPKMLNSIYLDLQQESGLSEIVSQCDSLAQRVDALFLEWSVKAKGTFSFDFIDYRTIPYLVEIHERNTKKYAPSEKIANYKYSAEKLEELSQAMFLLMVEDTMPEKLAMFPEPLWLNAWAMSLNPAKWQEDGLFTPHSKARDLSQMKKQLKTLYIFD